MVEAFPPKVMPLELANTMAPVEPPTDTMFCVCTDWSDAEMMIDCPVPDSTTRFPPCRTMFVPLMVETPAVLPDRVTYSLCAEFQSDGRTICVALAVVVAPAELKTVTVPVKSAIGLDSTCDRAIMRFRQ